MTQYSTFARNMTGAELDAHLDGLFGGPSPLDIDSMTTDEVRDTLADYGAQLSAGLSIPQIVGLIGVLHCRDDAAVAKSLGYQTNLFLARMHAAGVPADAVTTHLADAYAGMTTFVENRVAAVLGGAR